MTRNRELLVILIAREREEIRSKVERHSEKGRRWCGISGGRPGGGTQRRNRRIVIASPGGERSVAELCRKRDLTRSRIIAGREVKGMPTEAHQSQGPAGRSAAAGEPPAEKSTQRRGYIT